MTQFIGVSDVGLRGWLIPNTDPVKVSHLFLLLMSSFFHPYTVSITGSSRVSNEQSDKQE